MTLGEFLRSGNARPREAGTWDCCAFPSAWVQECGHADPMAAWRGTYDTETEGERLAAQGGGLVAMFTVAMEGVGLVRAARPWQPGDVAVVAILGREAGAVCTGARWAFVGRRGLAFARLDDECVLRGWRPRAHG